MKTIHLLLSFAVATVAGASSARAQSTLSQNKPTWWDKYQLLSKSGSDPAPGATGSATADGNGDVSDECGPQSETYITLNPVRPSILAAGANEIFRLPMRGYFSSAAGASWGGADLPLPPARRKRRELLGQRRGRPEGAGQGHRGRAFRRPRRRAVRGVERLQGEHHRLQSILRRRRHVGSRERRRRQAHPVRHRHSGRVLPRRPGLPRLRRRPVEPA